MAKAKPPNDPDLLQADPARINLATQGLNSTKRPPEVREALLSDKAVTLDGDWDIGAWDAPIIPIDTLDIYEALRDCLKAGKPWEETKFYKRVLRQISKGTVKWKCHDEEQWLRRLNVEVRGLYEEIAENGYKSQAELGSRHPQDDVRVGIRRDGRLLMFDGRHRLIIAKLLGIPSIPVRVVARHPEWVRFKEEMVVYARDHLRGRLYQQIDHSDLANLPAKHGNERMEFLLAALAGYDCTGKRLLDIGTHWGHMAQQMEKLGFQCTGLELNPDAASFARRLCVANEARYDVWVGDLLSYEPKEPFPVVLALSILHHMIKTEGKHEKLKALLGRLNPEVMLFEPHDPDASADQMKNAYRNYGPADFVAFVSQYTRLPNIEYLGTPDDRYKRPLYKLTR